MKKNECSVLEKAQTSLFNEIFVDNFAGGGGASVGVELAIGRPLDIAINHDPEAIAMVATALARANFPEYCVWDIATVAELMERMAV